MKYFFSLLIIMPICHAMAQTSCATLDEHLEFLRVNNHIVLHQMRYIRTSLQHEENHAFFNRSNEGVSDSYKQSDLKLFDMCGRPADMNLAYDNYSRLRVLQLLKNEFEEYELDSVVVRNATMLAKRYVGDVPENEFVTQDTVTNKAIQSKSMRMHVACLDSVTETLKQAERKLLLNTYRFDLRSIIELSGVLEHEGLVEQLLTMLNDTALSDYWESITLALVRHEVEPYYSEFLSSNRFVKGEGVDKMSAKVNYLLRYAPCQNSIFILSEYLSCDEYITLTTADGTEPYNWYIMDDAYMSLCHYLTNDDFIAMCKQFKCKNHLSHEECQKVVAWLRANFGKYKIKRFW